MGKPLGVGVVGVGNISGQYFENIPKLTNLKLIGVADLDVERAKKVAAAQGVQAFTVQEIYTAPNVDVILNLTLPLQEKFFPCFELIKSLLSFLQTLGNGTGVVFHD